MGVSKPSQKLANQRQIAVRVTTEDRARLNVLIGRLPGCTQGSLVRDAFLEGLAVIEKRFPEGKRPKSD